MRVVYLFGLLVVKTRVRRPCLVSSRGGVLQIAADENLVEELVAFVKDQLSISNIRVAQSQSYLQSVHVRADCAITLARDSRSQLEVAFLRA
jgi:hypothetical protein